MKITEQYDSGYRDWDLLELLIQFDSKGWIAVPPSNELCNATCIIVWLDSGTVLPAYMQPLPAQYG